MRRLFLLLFSAHMAASACAEECKSADHEDLHQFLSTFAGDKSFAVERTLYPLSVVKWHHGPDGDDVTPPTRSTLERRQDEASPSLAAAMKDEGLESYVVARNFKAAVVEVYKDGTGWVMTYHFSRMGRCWYLRELQDHSL